MKLEFPLNIAGVGRYLPDRVVTNDELAAVCGRSANWISERNGVNERRYVTHESNAFMGARAAEEALEAAELKLSDVDLILNASGTAQQSIPDNAVFIQRELGDDALGIATMSIHATCLSFLVALDTAASLLASGRRQNILIVSSEIASCALNPATPESFTLFGDGAAAVVVNKATQAPAMLHATGFRTYSDGADYTTIRGGGTLRHPNNASTTAEDNLFYMDGFAVLRYARRYLGPFLEELDAGLSQGLSDIDWVIPHQASKVGLRFLEAYNWPRPQIIETLAGLGNCVAASLPLTLYEAFKSGRLERGQKVLMLGTGAGLSMGGLIFTF